MYVRMYVCKRENHIPPIDKFNYENWHEMWKWLLKNSSSFPSFSRVCVRMHMQAFLSCIQYFSFFDLNRPVPKILISGQNISPFKAQTKNRKSFRRLVGHFSDNLRIQTIFCGLFLFSTSAGSISLSVWSEVIVLVRYDTSHTHSIFIWTS